MYHLWIAFSILILDQASKWYVSSQGFTETAPIAIGDLAFKLVTAKPLTEAEIGTALSNSNTLILLIGLLIVHLLVTRFSIQSHFISLRTLFALQMAGGAILSQAVDLALRAKVYSPVLFELGDAFTINAGIADLSLLLSFCVLIYVLFVSKPRLRSRVTLAPPDLSPLNFSPVPRGIDNIHIDVHLSPHFRENIEQLIQYLLPQVVSQLQQGKSRPVIPEKYSASARTAFKELLAFSLRKVRDSGEKQFPDLFITALLKFIHESINSAVSTLVKQSKEGENLYPVGGLASRAKESRQIEWLFRHRTYITSLTNLILSQTLFDLHSRGLEKSIKALYDKKNLFALQAMKAPVVLAGNGNDEHLQVKHYLLFAQQQSAPNSFINIDHVLNKAFKDCLSLIEEDEERTSAITTVSSPMVNSAMLDALHQPSVLMHPGNVAILLDLEWSTRKMNRSLQQGNWRRYNQFRKHQKFQKRLWFKINSEIKEAGLSPWINAAYLTQSILKAHHSDISPTLVLNLLARDCSEQEFQQRLRDALKSAQTPPPAEGLRQAWRDIHQEQKLLERYLLLFLQDFSRYRRDLMLLLIYQQGANDLRLLSQSQEIETSRANYTLYDFLHATEMRTVEAPILSHIIIKADLRGSTEVTEKLTELELNPATHFAQNFFVPINEVIDSYGAEKVFIEGDAIILILNEYGGPHQDHMLAARACGLAARILQIVEIQNKELEVYSLPTLELGIGIAFQEGAPRYLFDKQHRITISPAINRADRLSASTWSIRNWYKQQGLERPFVEVYLPSDKATAHGEKAQKELAYNINGINLEESVFKRLAGEQNLKKVSNTLTEIAESELYTGTFLDLEGNEQRLVIRKAPLHHYDPDHSVSECPTVEGRHFYEVIHRSELLAQLRKKR